MYYEEALLFLGSLVAHWSVVLVAALVGCFIHLHDRWRLDSRWHCYCLPAFAGLVTLRYLYDYPASAGTPLPWLITSLASAKIVFRIVRFYYDRVFGAMLFMMYAIIGILIIVCILPEVSRHQYYYAATPRISGVLGNPNIHGILAASGLCICIGMLVHYRAILLAGRITAGVAIVGSGLLFMWHLKGSYSRGAWAAAVLGTMIIVNVPISTGGNATPVRPRRKWLGPLIFLGLFGGITFGLAGSPVLARIITALDEYDLSMRNRLAAAEGLTRMMLVNPLHGFGWTDAALKYEEYFMADRLVDPNAIQMTGFFLIGAVLGIPALLLFGSSLISIPSVVVAETSGVSAALERLRMRRVFQSVVSVCAVGVACDGALYSWPVLALMWLCVDISDHISLGGIQNGRLDTRQYAELNGFQGNRRAKPMFTFNSTAGQR